jgi:hypothetical protein
MWFWSCLLFLLFLFGGPAIEARGAESLSAQFDAPSRVRRADTWQFLASLGVGVSGFSAAQAKPIDDFQAAHGLGIPLSLSVAAYHPHRESQWHFGYSIDSFIHTKTVSVYVADTTSSFSEAILGAGFLLYFTGERRSYLRMSAGLAGASFQYVDRYGDYEETKSRLDYTNGWGAVVEVGSIFSIEAPNGAEAFSYGLQIGRTTAVNGRYGELSNVFATAKVGILF